MYINQKNSSKHNNMVNKSTDVENAQQAQGKWPPDCKLPPPVSEYTMGKEQ